MAATGAKNYEIRVQGQLDSHWNSWFEGLTLTPLVNGETLDALDALPHDSHFSCHCCNDDIIYCLPVQVDAPNNCDHI